MTATIQLRGHCQTCGRVQAVSRGAIAKHGYRIEDRGNYGWFAGTCSGSDRAPIEAERTLADARIASANEDAAQLAARAAGLRAGDVVPAFVRTTRLARNPETGKLEPVLKPWAEATEYERAEEIRCQAYTAESHGRAAQSWADSHAALVARVHGEPLQEVAKAAGPEPILNGDTRRSGADVVLKATGVDRGMVFWLRQSDGRRGRMSTRSWRLLSRA